MLRVGIIGMGNAGNQVAELAAIEAKIDGIAINSSDNDLKNVSHVSKLKIGDARGAGKDRTEAKSFIKVRIKDFIGDDHVMEFFSDKDVVFVVTSIDGGTGSGSTPVFFDIVKTKWKDVKFILVPIYPDWSQGPASLQNGIDFLKEVYTNIKDCVKVSFDNAKRDYMAPDEMIRTVNREIVEAIKVIRMDYMFDTPVESIDEKDLTKIITMPGEMVVLQWSGFTEADLDKESIEEHLIKLVKGGTAQTDIERDKIIKCMGVISNLNDDIKNKFDPSLSKLKEIVGEPVLPFKHYYVNDGETNDVNRVIVILSGLSVPDSRIKAMDERLKEVEKDLLRTKKSSVLDSVNTSTVASLRKQSEEEASGELNMDDIFGKY